MSVGELSTTTPGNAPLLRVRGRDLEAILAQLRQLMSADTATILLLDRSRTMLEPIATSGLDRTLRGARRIPIGHGFAGRVAATGAPYALADVSPSTVLNPVLLNRGVRSLLGVPMLARGRLFGIVHVGWLQRHDFGPEEIAVLERAAAELSAEVLRRQAEDDRTAALVLQRSLLPSAPTTVKGLSLATRYIPAEGDLGGDWYDVFSLDDERLAIVMGDVLGHGLQAAVIMGRLRSALRAYALEHEDPADVLSRLDAKISHFEKGALATVLYGVSSYPFETWMLSSAGHVNPVIAAPGEAVRELWLGHDLLLGFRPQEPRTTTAVTLPLGASICLFTDGLIERRPSAGSSHFDDIGLNLNRLMQAFSCEDDPELAASRIISTVVGDLVAEDDMALLVARREP
jgi:serine phosphatase RsbU (regulator of sigma subunit)